MNSLLITFIILTTNPTPNFNESVDQSIQNLILVGTQWEQSPAPPKSKLYNSLGWGVHISQWGDFLSTEVVLANGGYEQNPFMQYRGARVAASVAGPTLINWLSNEIHPDHPKIALLMRVGVIVANGYLIQHNMRVANRLGGN